ncbi:hypothetical protein VN23_04335 [Janthinobacterium sp. B9-8]|nr:hypothetical protein VN23_04335 [Janthinobacterium sp. B9-8]
MPHNMAVERDGRKLRLCFRIAVALRKTWALFFAVAIRLTWHSSRLAGTCGFFIQLQRRPAA